MHRHTSTPLPPPPHGGARAGDYNPIHVSPAVASALGFKGGVIAHGASLVHASTQAVLQLANAHSDAPGARTASTVFGGLPLPAAAGAAGRPGGSGSSGGWRLSAWFVRPSFLPGTYALGVTSDAATARAGGARRWGVVAHKSGKVNIVVEAARA
jgi:acyl dehydratase